MLDRYNPGHPQVRDEAEEATLHSHDMRPPVMVLGQNQSQGGTAGKFQRTDTQEEFECLEVVPLVVRRSRLKWPAQKFSRDLRPECWSDDGLVGSSRPIKDVPPLFPGRGCSGCDFYTAQPWAVDRDGGWCMPGYNLLLMDAQSYEVYLMRLRGSSAKVARILGAKGVYHRAVVALTAALVQTAAGTWWQLQARVLQRLGEDDLSLIRDMYRDFTGSAVEGGDAPEAVLAQDEERPETQAEVPMAGERAGSPVDQRPRSGSRKFEGGPPGMEQSLAPSRAESDPLKELPF